MSQNLKIQVVIGEFDKYHLIPRVLFSCFKPPTVITSLARFGLMEAQDW